MITNCLKSIKQKSPSATPVPGETKLDTNLTKEQQKLNEKIYQRKMSISFRKRVKKSSTDTHIEKIPKMKRSSSAPQFHKKKNMILDETKSPPVIIDLSNQRLGSIHLKEERKNFKIKMQQQSKTNSNQNGSGND
jgi:hypothetical protein